MIKTKLPKLRSYEQTRADCVKYLRDLANQIKKCKNLESFKIDETYHRSSLHYTGEPGFLLGMTTFISIERGKTR